jgi:ADP-heptose:LPS heptosyltransferase
MYNSEMPGLSPPFPASNLLVLRSGGIGDFVLTLPVLRALRRAWPQARLELVGHRGIAELARGRGYADSVRSIDEAWVTRLFTPLERVDASSLPFHRGSFDLAVSFLDDRDGQLRRNLAGLARRLVVVPLPTRSDVHVVEQFLSPLAAVGVAAAELVPRVFMSSDDLRLGQSALHNLGFADGTPLACLHPGSGARAKNWPAERFAEVAEGLRRSGQAEVLVVEGEADAEPVSAMFAAIPGPKPPVLRNRPLLEVAAALQQTRLLIGNDSGISHLAAAVGTPVLALFGPTSPTAWRPLGEPVRVMTFAEASPAAVLVAALDLLAGLSGRSRRSSRTELRLGPAEA